MTTDNNDLGNKPHESPAGTKIYAFKISTTTGYQSGRVEAHDHREAQQRACDSTPGKVLRGQIHLLADQDRARNEPFIALEKQS
jgi:hypothetical protein